MIAISPELNSSSLFQSFNFFKTVFPAKVEKVKEGSKISDIKISLTFDKASGIVLFLNELIAAFRDELVMLSPKEAEKILKKVSLFQQLYDEFFDSMKDYQTQDLSEYHLINNLVGLVQNLEGFQYELTTIANRPPIDEDSEEYQQFLKELTTHGLQSERSKIGNSLEEIL